MEAHVRSRRSPLGGPYTSYKASPVDWLPEPPDHWEVKPLKRLACYVSRGDGPDYVDDSATKVINQACIQWSGLRLENVKYEDQQDISHCASRFCRGDLLVNSTGTLGRCAVFTEDGTYMANSHVTTIRFLAREMMPQFAYYLLRTPCATRAHGTARVLAFTC